MKCKPSVHSWIAFAFFCITLLPIVLTASDIGLTYDEPIYGGASLKLAEWLKEGISDLAHGDILTPLKPATIERYWGAKDMQPPTAKYLTAVSLMTLTPVIGYLPAVRFGSAFLLAIAVVILYLWGTQAYNRTVGVVAAFSLMLMPCVWGHAHLTAMDIPVAAMTFAMAFTVWKTVQSPTWARTIMTGIVAGLAVGTKMNALVIYAVLLPWSFAHGRRVSFKVAAALLLIAPLVFFASWPWLWLDPLSHIEQYLKFQLKHYPIGVSYFGRIYVIPPWHYPFVMTAITTPLMTVALALLGLGSVATQSSKQRMTGALIAGCFLVQLAAFAMPGVPKYNGTRLFLSVFPFMAMLAGIGFDWSATRCLQLKLFQNATVPGNHRLRNQVTVVLAAACLVPGLRAIVLIHPFELSYYNQLIGGLRGAVARGFEPTYWGDAYFQTLNFFNAKAPAGSVLNISPPGVVSYFRMYQRSGALRDDLQLSSGEDNLPRADFAVFHTRQGEMSPLTLRLFKEGRPLYTVECEGVPMAVVYDRAEIHRVCVSHRTNHQPSNH